MTAQHDQAREAPSRCLLRFSWRRRHDVVPGKARAGVIKSPCALRAQNFNQALRHLSGDPSDVCLTRSTCTAAFGFSSRARSIAFA